MTNPYLLPYSYPYSTLYPSPKRPKYLPYSYYPYYPYYQMYPPSYPTTPAAYPIPTTFPQQFFPTPQAPFHTAYPHHLGAIGGYGQFHLHTTPHILTSPHGAHITTPHAGAHVSAPHAGAHRQTS